VKIDLKRKHLNSGQDLLKEKYWFKNIWWFEHLNTRQHLVIDIFVHFFHFWNSVHFLKFMLWCPVGTHFLIKIVFIFFLAIWIAGKACKKIDFVFSNLLSNHLNNTSHLAKFQNECFLFFIFAHTCVRALAL
jgi:hypothetical protein